MARLGRAQAFKPRYGIRALVSPVAAGPYYPTVAVNDNSDGGISWAQPLHVTAFGDSAFSNMSSQSASMSQFLSTSGYGFNIDPTKSVAGIVVELLGAFNVGGSASALTCRLIKDTSGTGVIRVMNRATAAISGTLDYTLGGPLDSWNESWTPTQINSSLFGVVVRKEGSENAQLAVDAVRITVYSTDSVLLYNNYAAGAYTFGPTPIAVNATSITFYVDINQHTDVAIVWTLATEISFDSGSTWGPLVSMSREGGVTTGSSGVVEARGWARHPLYDSTNANRQFRGTLTITGGSLFTSVGCFVN